MCVIREIGSFSRVYNVFCKWYFEYCTSISKSLNDSSFRDVYFKSSSDFIGF